MKNKLVKKLLSAGLAAAMAVTMLAGCGGGKSGGETDGSGKDASFTWWIFSNDGAGEYFDDYAEGPIAQYINAQYWDVENGGIGTAETGRKLKLSYLVPVGGSESDNFNTMINTGEYPEIMDLVISSDSAQTMHESGILMDITEYVEKYMPNYLAYLDANPELKPLVSAKEEDGSIHYYAVYSLAEGIQEPWHGFCYRRDWVVKYAEPTEYVWDRESDYVKENGHPAVTPLEKAIKENNLEGWKKNDVSNFTADYGENPVEDYTDNVIFPSGTENPLTISDWEWMFTAFEKAIEKRGWSDDSSAYCTTVFYPGFMQTGDLVSSFGGGTGGYYVKDGEVTFDGDSENFKTYLECMNTWYEKGWLDSQFNTRASDIFFSINTTGVNQGKVGLWDGLTSTVGTAIRTSCQNEEDAKDAIAMGCALPINDMYGTEEQMYKDPDALYQQSRKGTATGITTKAEGKDLETLFTFLDWTYTMDGALTMRIGLNEEQLESVDLDPDLYAEYNLTTAYTEEQGEDGRTIYKKAVDSSNTITGALMGQRMDVGIIPIYSDEYIVDSAAPMLNKEAVEQWRLYINKGSALDYVSLLSSEESEKYNKVSQQVTDYQNQNVPKVIMGKMTWDDYVKGFESINPDSVTEYLQKYVESANAEK